MKPGATFHDGTCDFRVWAPAAQEVLLRLEGPGARTEAMQADADGYYNLHVGNVRAGQRYAYVVDGSVLPDPCSRFQPEGPHGPSQIVDGNAYVWHDSGWAGIALTGLVVYELHVGAFTQDGTLAAAAQRLPHLRALGITAVELMPMAECPGRFNWGYDGVNWFAPTRNYGGPDALKAFVDAAHAQGIGVILDVVYNHFGPDGNYLRSFSADYFSAARTEWGDAINYDGARSAPVRELVVANAAAWVREFHLDGLRLDATQSIFDGSARHLVAELSAAARAAAGDRPILIIAENEPQRGEQVGPEDEGGLGIDALWNDDFHHAARVAATGRREAYFVDYLGSPQEFVSSAKRGFLFQGQYYRWQKQARGAPLRGPSMHCVTYLQNHDQIPNSLQGLRLHQVAAPGMVRALTAVLLLGPQTPLLFMGQEFHASSPFLFFADHQGELRELVREGRRAFLAQFPGAASSDGAAQVADPGDERTFQRCKLDWRECHDDNPALRLHRDLLRLRREDPVIRGQGRDGFDGAVLGERAFLLRWFSDDAGDRLLVVNLGEDVRDRPMPEPLLAAPPGTAWSLLWSSDHTDYGGAGTVDPRPAQGWLLPGQSAVLLGARGLETGSP